MLTRGLCLSLIYGILAATAPYAWASRHFDVVVIGAGPTGLVAAIEAAKQGASVLLLEKRQSHESPAAHAWGSRNRVIGLQVRTYENLKELGANIPAANVVSLEIHNTSGEKLDSNVQEFQSAGLVKQAHATIGLIEGALMAKARTLPIEIVFGAEQTEFATGAEKTLTFVRDGKLEKIDFTFAAVATGSNTTRFEPIFGARIQNTKVNANPMITADFKVNEDAGGFDMLKDLGNAGMIRAVALTANGHSSISVVETKELRKLTGPEFEAKARETLLAALKNFRLTGTMISGPTRFDLGQDRITRVHHNGIFALGDAARKTNPTTGLGVNLGVKDAAAFGMLVQVFKHEPQKIDTAVKWLENIINQNTQTSADKSEKIQAILQRESARFFNNTCKKDLTGAAA